MFFISKALKPFTDTALSQTSSGRGNIFYAFSNGSHPVQNKNVSDRAASVRCTLLILLRSVDGGCV